MITKYQGIPVQTKSKTIITWTNKELEVLDRLVKSSSTQDAAFRQYAQQTGRTFVSVHRRYQRYKNNKVTPTKTLKNWRPEEESILMSTADMYSNKTRAFTEAGKQLNRTVQACASRYHQILNSKVTESAKHIFIPEVKQYGTINSNTLLSNVPSSNVFIDIVQVTMYKALDNSLHQVEQDAIKSNVRTIIDSIPDKEVDDRELHTWFHSNKDKVEYLLNNSPKTIWN